MAAPTVRAYAAATNNTDAAPAFTVTQPAGVATGDLLIAFAVNDSTGTAWTVSPGNGWQQISDENDGNIRLGLWAKVASGTDALSIAAANNQDASCTIIAIQTGTHGVADIAQDIQTITAATGASGNADPPAIINKWGRDWLAIAVCAVDMTATGDSISAQPSGYDATNVLTKSASSTSSVGLGVAHKALTSASSEDPGTFTNTSRAWVAKTLLVPPAGEPPKGFGTWALMAPRRAA